MHLVEQHEAPLERLQPLHHALGLEAAFARVHEHRVRADADGHLGAGRGARARARLQTHQVAERVVVAALGREPHHLRVVDRTPQLKLHTTTATKHTLSI